MDSLTLTRHNSFQNQNNRQTTHSFATSLLIFKLHNKKFEKKTLRELCSPKTDLETNFLNLKNWKF